MRKRRLQIRISYEPNRLAETNLSNTYEKLIQTIKHPVNIREKEINNNAEITIYQSLKGNLKC